MHVFCVHFKLATERIVKNKGCWVEGSCKNKSRVYSLSFLHTHTVCVTYYKASPYNISHTKNIFTAKYNRVIYANTIILKLHMHIKRRQFQ